MTSREIAVLTGKAHPKVTADILNLCAALETDAAGFRCTYKDAAGRPQVEYVLQKRETLILVSGYSVVMRAKIIDRWQDLERKAAEPAVVAFKIPQTLGEALRLAAA